MRDMSNLETMSVRLSSKVKAVDVWICRITKVAAMKPGLAKISEIVGTV